MAATAPASSALLLDLIQKSGILSAQRFAALPRPETLPAEPQKAASVLVKKGFLTRFQAGQLLAGRHKGFRLGQYVVLDMLGRGGMGAVYLAEHLDLRRKVAVKVLTAVGKASDQRLAQERFLREARAVAALDHPNIVRIFDVSRYNDTPYLVMEYVDGETLQQTLDRDGCVPPEMAAEYVAQAAAGLQHAHEKGFVHRDIKPGNLIRDRFGVVKLLDMGLARSGCDTDKLTEKLDSGAVVGTADFISPEQAINCPSVDSRADIYSLGATLFTLVAGKPPFDGNVTQKLIQHQLKDAPVLAEVKPDVPAVLSAAVAKMLAKKAEDRFQTPGEVIAALAPWAESSARVIAGLSRTALGQTVDMNLTDRSGQGSSLSGLRTVSPALPGDSAALDLADAARATGSLSASETARTRTPAPRPAPLSLTGTHEVPMLPAPRPQPRARAPQKRPKPAWLPWAVGAALLVVGVLIGWLAFAK
jgi:eukaryotic-like serine/threonine-protein kinase